MNPDPKEWIRLWHEAKAAGDPVPWFERLTASYSEPHRHYHTFHHIAECLAEFSPARSLALQPAAVEMALWFHDAVCDPHASDNEERSAALAEHCLSEARAPGDFIGAVRRLVLATKTHDASTDADAPLLVDVDLSILGKPEARFWEYEEQVRQEYSWVPQWIFAPKRAAILQGFLVRTQIYSTPFFREKYEAQARTNLQSSIRKLKGG